MARNTSSIVLTKMRCPNQLFSLIFRYMGGKTEEAKWDLHNSKCMEKLNMRKVA